MLSNAYFLAKFRFDTAENEPAKNLQNFRKMHFRKMYFRKMHFRKMHFQKMHFRKCIFEKCIFEKKFEKEFSRAQVGGHVGNSPGPQILLLWRWSEHFEAGLEAYLRMDPKILTVRSSWYRRRIK